jgi:hypothetical protein
MPDNNLFPGFTEETVEGKNLAIEDPCPCLASVVVAAEVSGQVEP